MNLFCDRIYLKRKCLAKLINFYGQLTLGRGGVFKFAVYSRQTERAGCKQKRRGEKWIEANSAFSFVGLLSYKQKRGLKAIQQLWEENGFSNPLSPCKKYISLEAFAGLIFGVHPHKVCLSFMLSSLCIASRMAGIQRLFSHV